MFAFAEDAQARQLVTEQKSGTYDPPVLKKRYRDDTPLEELNLDHEKRFKAAEDRDDERAERNDLAFHDSFRSTTSSSTN